MSNEYEVNGIETLVKYYIEKAENREQREHVSRALKEFVHKCEEIFDPEASEVHFHDDDANNPCRGGEKWCASLGQYIPCEDICP